MCSTKWVVFCCSHLQQQVLEKRFKKTGCFSGFEAIEVLCLCVSGRHGRIENQRDSWKVHMKLLQFFKLCQCSEGQKNEGKFAKKTETSCFSLISAFMFCRGERCFFGSGGEWGWCIKEWNLDLLILQRWGFGGSQCHRSNLSEA